MSDQDVRKQYLDKLRKDAAQRRLSELKKEMNDKLRIETFESRMKVELRSEGGAKFWPAGVPKPTHWKRRLPIPCDKCGCTYLADGGQAVMCSSTHEEVAYLKCKACKHRWPAPIKEV